MAKPELRYAEIQDANAVIHGHGLTTFCFVVFFCTAPETSCCGNYL